MFIGFVLLGFALALLSGVPGLINRRATEGGEKAATRLMIGSTLFGLAGAFGGLWCANEKALFVSWPIFGKGLLTLDPLAAFFLVPVFLIGGLGAIYGLDYWPQSRHPDTGRGLRACWGFLVAGMVLLLISQHAMIFLLGWELMALAAYFLIVTEERQPECQQAGWVYLIATHTGTLVLLTLFSLWRYTTGSYDLIPATTSLVPASTAGAFFVLALLGFGLKAGIMPLHFWLPGAHANAPSHVSAIMSGVVLKMGVYGLIRWCTLLSQPPASWGIVVLVLGAVSGLLGVVFAIGQHDLKKLLAYHSVENIGIIFMGLGVALLGRTYDRPVWVALGLAGALLHVWNHGLFKSLLFLAAGAIVKQTGTRQIDRMGGLARVMPHTTLFFLIGAIAICGLPPLNGFISEWFIYIGMLRTAIPETTIGMGALPAIPVLAMIGALAVACFVKVYGTVFLGAPRTPEAARAKPIPRTMRRIMLILTLSCAVIGLLPASVAPLLDKVTACWSAPTLSPTLCTLTPLHILSLLSVLLLLMILCLAIYARRHVARALHGPTWDCGYAQPTARMQYTATSFAQMIVALFRPVLRPFRLAPRVEGIFPQPTHTHSHVDDAVLHRLLLPLSARLAQRFSWFRRFQRGFVQDYLLYILLAVIALFIWGNLGA